MNTFSLNELRRLSKTELKDLKKNADKGDARAMCKMAMCVIYAQSEDDMQTCIPYLEKASDAGNSLALLLLGYVHEHALGTSKDYAKSVESYSKAYDLLSDNTPSKSIKKEYSKALKEMERRYDKLIQQVSNILTVKNYCVFQKEQFIFPWTAETRKKTDKLLLQLSKGIAEFGQLYESTITNLQDDEQGRWEFAYQDTLLTPFEIMKTLAARDYLGRYLENNGFQHLPADPYFDNALGRCLIDDDDTQDYDYVIGGLLKMAGHESSPLWQYRVGLWYEYSDFNHEPKTAAYWFYQAAGGSTAAKEGLKRIKNKLEYRMLDDPKVGTVDDCKKLSLRSSKNPLCSMVWSTEAALRGDESSIKRLTKIQSFSDNNNTIFRDAIFVSHMPQPYYSLLKEENVADKTVKAGWIRRMKEEKESYHKQIAENERKELETKRRAKEEEKKKSEAIRKAEKDARKKLEIEAKKEGKATAPKMSGKKAKTNINESLSGIEDARKEQMLLLDNLVKKMAFVKGGEFIMGTGRTSHRVRLSSFHICRNRVTQELWNIVMGDVPSNNLPMVNVSWNDCQNFIHKLSTITKRKFRLPTEAEWEYAATHKEGMNDMPGRIREWCNDWYSASISCYSDNPQGPSSGHSRVYRGGNYTSRYYGYPSYKSKNLGFRLAEDRKKKL